jgi:hypothetical protein
MKLILLINTSNKYALHEKGWNYTQSEVNHTTSIGGQLCMPQSPSASNSICFWLGHTCRKVRGQEPDKS